jgi:hypothetical protein
MRPYASIAAGLLFLAASLVPAGAVEISVSRYREDVRYLSSENLKGRGTGTSELDKAADYILKEFARAGLKPVSGSGYLQSFPVAVKATLGDDNHLNWTLGGTRKDLKPGDDFVPFSFSGSGTVSAPVVFAGYGITGREYGYDDYADIDVRGKMVVILRHEPQEYESASVFEGRVYTEHSQLFSKAVNARAHGAVAVLLVNDTNSHSTDPMDKFTSAVGPADPGIPFVQVRSEIVREWFQASGADLDAVQQEIDRTLQPHSFALSGVEIELQVNVRHTTRDAYNVAGYWPGESGEYIIIGAHYDHLGLGEQYSMAPEMAGHTHPGADDNASGTAGLLALARWFTTQPKMRRGVLFLAFAGEELGLLGSSHYVNNPLLPLEKAALMINMDMIGRLRDGKVIVGSVDSGVGLRSIVERAAQRHGFALDLGPDAVYGSSDHTAFKTKLMPVLFFFTGLHGDYHKPTDTWDKVDVKKTAELLEMIGEVVTELAGRSPRPQFVVAPNRNGSPASTAGAGAAAGSGH